MAPAEPLNQEQRRLLRIAARMPLASAANLAAVLDLPEDRVRRMLRALHDDGWVESLARGMTEPRRQRWFLTRKAVNALYVNDHQHPSPRKEAPRPGPGPGPPPKANCPKTTGSTTGSATPWTTTTPPTWNPRTVPPSPRPSRQRTIPPVQVRATSTRPGPPRQGASRHPCAAWPCWSRSTGWPRTWCAADG